MLPSSVCLLVVATVALTCCTCTAAVPFNVAAPNSLEKRQSSAAAAPTMLSYGFYNPSNNTGSWLTLARNAAGLGEPLNVVVSANSDPFILTTEGLTDWFWSINYSEEFLGQSLGARQAANLGDGKGQVNQTDILRYNYGDIYYGTLKESIEGGSHVRYWRQNGTLADSGAWFIAASDEMSAQENHMIVPNGYDLGRDHVAGNATLETGTKSPQTNRTFAASVEYVSGFLPANSSEGINHGIPTDGRVAVLTVKVTSADANLAGAGATSAGTSLFSSLATLAATSTVGALALSLLL